MRVMPGLAAAILLALALSACGQPAAPLPSAPPPKVIHRDAALFAQDTPRDALASCIKAMETSRADYFIAFLLTPESRDRSIATKNGDVEAVIKGVTENPQRLAGQINLFKQFLQQDHLEELEIEQGEKKLKVARFRMEGQSAFLQFEFDGEFWGLNAHTGRPDPNAALFQAGKSSAADAAASTSESKSEVPAAETKTEASTQP